MIFVIIKDEVQYKNAMDILNKYGFEIRNLETNTSIIFPLTIVISISFKYFWMHPNSIIESPDIINLDDLDAYLLLETI